MSRRWRIALPLIAGVGAMVIAAAWGVTGFLIVLACCVALNLAGRLFVILALPARQRQMMRARLNPDIGPPEGAVPVRLELSERLHAATAEGDWHALGRLLTEDFALVDPSGRRHSKRAYVRLLKQMRRVYPDLRSDTEALMAEAGHPERVWFRTHVTGRPRRGPALDATGWTRMTTTADGGQARELAHMGVIRVA